MNARIARSMLLVVLAAVALVGWSTSLWAQGCPAQPLYSPDFTSNQSCTTLNGNATYPAPVGSAATIRSWSGSNGVVTFQATNSFTAGEVIILSGFANSTFFNNLAFPVLRTGLSSRQFEISFTGFTGPSDTGTATPLRPLQLTPAKSKQAGSAWFNTQQPVSGGFSSTFTFQLRGATTYPADGIAFVIQNSTQVNGQGNPTALGPNGCGIGFGDSSTGCTTSTGGIPNSLAVELNTYLNSGIDKSANSVSIQSNGTNANCVDPSCTLPGGLNYQLPVTMTDGNIHTVQVSYSLLSTPTETSCFVNGSPGPCLDVIMDGHDLFPTGVAVNLSTLLNLNNLQNAWVGFTGGTGSGNDYQYILSWTFTTEGQSQSGTVTTTTPTLYNYSGGQANGGNDYNAQLTSGTSTTAVVTEIPIVSQAACNAIVQANPLFNTAQCFVYSNGGGPGIDEPIMYELTCPGSSTGGTCGSAELPNFTAILGSDWNFDFTENVPLSDNTFGFPNLTSLTGLPAVGYLKGSGPDPLHPCTPYAGNNPPLFQSNQILSFALGDTSGGLKSKAGGTGSCWLATYLTPGEVPTVSLTSPTNNAVYQQGQMVLANYTCSAVNAGANSTVGPYLTVSSCSATDTPGGSIANGAPIDTTTLGNHTFTASVLDSATNTSATTVTYDVQTTQSINFPPIPNQTYGVPPIALNATASSGLPVSYSVTSGPASVSGNMLTITGVGSVSVTANQAGNSSYAPATPVAQGFSVTQQAPSVSVTSVSPSSEVYGSGMPTTVTASLSWTGSGVAPTGGLTFTATAAGTFGAPNCSGASSPIVCTATFTPAATDGANSYTMSAHYAGDTNYGAAGSTQINNFGISAAMLTVTATSAVGTYGQPLPPLIYTIMGFVNSDTQASATTGSPAEGTAASPTSAPAMYPIVITQGTLAAPNYTFLFVNGTLTLQQAASTTVLTSVDGSIYPNQSTTLTATVSVTGSGAAPTGNVSFMLGATLLGSGTLSPIDATDSSASITLNGSQLALGSNSITAMYSGDQNYGGSPSNAINVSLLSQQINFGTANVGSPAATQLVTYYFSSPTTLSAVNIETKGASGLDYTDAGSSTCTANTAYSAGQSCVVSVALTPSAPGLRSGAVTLFAQGTNLPLMTWYLNAVGLAGAAAVDPGAQTTIGTLANNGQAYGAAVDGAGNVYVVDHTNSIVVELAAGSFTQSTVVSSGLSSPTAVALDGAGNLYISDTGNGRVVVVPNEQGGLNSADTSAINIDGLGSPRGVATDGAGNLYVADGTNGNVLEVPAGGGTAITVASGLTNPHGVAVDAGGNVYVASDNQVAEYPFVSTGTYGTPIPMGTGYNSPRGLAVDAAGAVYVADNGNSQVVRVAPGGGSQATFPVSGLTGPQGVAVDAADNVYVTDPSIVIQINRTLVAALSFPSTNVDSTSAAQTLTVSNSGNQALTLSNLVITANFTQLPSGGTDCTSSSQLVTGGQCLIAVAFAPTVSGPLAGTLTVSDNALNNAGSSQIVQLNGNATQVSQTIAFTAIGNQTYGVMPITLNATASSGLVPVTFSVTSGPATVSGNMLTITGAGPVTVQASQAGNIEYAQAMTSQMFSVSTATLTITANNQNMVYGGTVPPLTAGYNGFVNGDGPGSLAGTLSCTTTGGSSSPAGPYPINCTGQSSPNYTINYMPGTLNIGQAGTSTTVGSNQNPSVFGQAVLLTASVSPASGTGETGTVTWSANTGCGTTPVTSGNPGTATCLTSALPVGSDSITATYSGDTNHTGSGGGWTQTVNQAPAFTSANSTTFSSGVAGSFTVTATGIPTPTITESGALPSGIVFTGGSGTAKLSGTTSAVGTYVISLMATNAAGTVTQTFTLVVSGPSVTVSPTSLTFTSVKCRSSATSGVTITNTGGATLTISKVWLTLGANTDSDDFSYKNGCSSSLLSGKSCTINVTYSPDDGGSQSATLSISDNAPGSPQNVSITGTNTCKPERD